MHNRVWKKFFLLQNLIVLAAMGYVWLDAKRYFLVPPAIVVALAFIMFIIVSLKFRKSILLENQSNLEDHKTEQPWETDKNE